MGTWNVTAGTWEMVREGEAPSSVTLERSGGIPVAFAPGSTTCASL
jgi:hypothetical protein